MTMLKKTNCECLEVHMMGDRTRNFKEHAVARGTWRKDDGLDVYQAERDGEGRRVACGNRASRKTLDE